MPFSIRPFRRLPLAYFSSGFWLLVTLLILLCSGPAYAEWVEITTGDNGNMTIYADPDTIRRKGELVKVWVLADYKSIQSNGASRYLSSRGQREADCAEERQRWLAFATFTGNMGSGNIVHADSDIDKWEPVAPRSISEALWKFACAKP